MPRETNPQSTETGGVNKQDNQNSTVNKPDSGANESARQNDPSTGRSTGVQEEGMGKQG